MFGISPQVSINQGAKLPQVKLIEDKTYDSLIVRVLMRSIRMGVIAASAEFLAYPELATKMLVELPLILEGNFVGVELLAMPIIIAFIAGVEKTWRETSKKKE